MSASRLNLRRIITATCGPSNRSSLYEQFCEAMAEDIAYCCRPGETYMTMRWAFLMQFSTSCYSCLMTPFSQ